MTTHFIAAEVDRHDTPSELQQAIEAELKRQGEPLRWAITGVTEDKAQVEAVVVVDTESVPAG